MQGPPVVRLLRHGMAVEGWVKFMCERGAKEAGKLWFADRRCVVQDGRHMHFYFTAGVCAPTGKHLGEPI
jgi:hypothetical protein